MVTECETQILLLSIDDAWTEYLRELDDLAPERVRMWQPRV